VTTQFNYCYISGYANPPASNLTVSVATATTISLFSSQIEDRLSYDYQLLEELMLPLEALLGYESAQLGNDSITYHRLAVVQRELNNSLREIQSIVSWCTCKHLSIREFSHIAAK